MDLICLFHDIDGDLVNRSWCDRHRAGAELMIVSEILGRRG